MSAALRALLVTVGALVVTFALSHAAQEVGEDAPTSSAARRATPFELGPARLRAALAGIDPTTTPIAFAPPFARPDRVPSLASDAWLDPLAWEAWGRALASAAEERAPNKDGARASDTSGAPRAQPDDDRATARARLALFALAQERWDDAWEHLAHAGRDPRQFAALLPCFLPGVPVDTVVGRGGHSAPLPDGVVLAPAVPPPTDVAEQRMSRREMTVRGVQIGGAVIDLVIALESEGVQIDVRHVEGTAARVAIRLPRVAGTTYANEYVDWFRQETGGVAHVIELQPGDEEHTVYGRFEPVDQRLPQTLPTVLPAQLERGVLWLVLPTGSVEEKAVEALAQLLSRAPFALAARRVTTLTPDLEPAGVRVDLVDPRLRARKLAWLASLAERWALR